MQPDVRQILSDLWSLCGNEPGALARVRLTGAEPVLPSSFRVDAAAQASIAAAGLAAAELGRARGGAAQGVSVDMRRAAIEFRSEHYVRVGSAPPPEIWDKIAGTYPCGDGRWVRLHTNFPHHRDGVLRILGCAWDRAEVAKALLGWKAEDFETACAEAQIVGSMMRTFEEWDAHPHGQAIARLPLLTIERIADAPPERLAPGSRPLSAIRVLDLTRVIAGPVCGRMLAAHGADVMNITAPHLPAMGQLVIDTGRGKLAASLDLRTPEDRAALSGLVRDSHVFVQGYRPGGVAAHGFGPEQLARLRPGIVAVSLSAYGHEGPWAGKRGFDSLVQTATGFNHAEGVAAGMPGKPKPLPCQALDFASGYLMAYGALVALRRRLAEGGSWHVRVSLVQTAHWLRSLGRLPNGLAIKDTRFEDVADLLETTDSGFGRLTAVRHPIDMDATPPRWERPAMPLGTHAARWPA